MQEENADNKETNKLVKQTSKSSCNSLILHTLLDSDLGPVPSSLLKCPRRYVGVTLLVFVFVTFSPYTITTHTTIWQTDCNLVAPLLSFFPSSHWDFFLVVRWLYTLPNWRTPIFIWKKSSVVPRDFSIVRFSHCWQSPKHIPYITPWHCKYLRINSEN